MLFVLLFIAYPLRGQVWRIGAKVEGYSLSRNFSETQREDSYVNSFYLFVNKKLNTNWELSVQPGFLLGDAAGYFGSEINFMCNYSLDESPLYLSGGVNFHRNYGNKSHNSYYYPNVITNGIAGIGLSTGNFLFHASLLFPLGNNEIGNVNGVNPDGSQKYSSIKLTTIIKLGIGIYIDL